MKDIALVLILAASLVRGEEFQLNSIIASDLWTEGFTAEVKTTSNFPGAKAEITYKIFADEEGNVRTESGDKIILFIPGEESGQIYNYNKVTKTCAILSDADFQNGFEGMEKPPELDGEESVDLVGSELFAGAACNKYKMNTRGTGIEGDLFLFVNSDDQIFMGYEIRSGEKFKRTEYSGAEFEVDDELFKPLEGYITK